MCVWYFYPNSLFLFFLRGELKRLSFHWGFCGLTTIFLGYTEGKEKTCVFFLRLAGGGGSLGYCCWGLMSITAVQKGRERKKNITKGRRQKKNSGIFKCNVYKKEGAFLRWGKKKKRENNRVCNLKMPAVPSST